MKTHFTYEFVQAIIYNEDLENLKLLFAKITNIDVNYIDKTGYSLLCFAIHYGKLKSVQFLLEKGADVHQKNTNVHDETPLHLAAQDYNLYIIKLLLQYGADINVVNGKGQTPLMFACEHLDADIQFLIDAKADIFAKDIFNK